MIKQNSQSPYAALQYKEFVAFISANCLITMAVLIQEVVLGYSIYKITHDPLALGIIGLAEALPYISLVLYGGHLADQLDRTKIMKTSLAVMIAASIFLIWSTHPSTGLSQKMLLISIYVVIVFIGIAKAFYSPASNSLTAFLIPKEVFTNAATWKSSSWQIGSIIGPGLAGFLYAYLGLTVTLWIVVIILICVLLLISAITAPDIAFNNSHQLPIFKSLLEGIHYVFKTKIILYSISLDLFSVLFGGVIALLPIYSEDILHVGAEGLGILRAAPSVGAGLTMLLLIYFPPMQKAWKNLLLSIIGFGIATLVFAVSKNVWISAIALFLTGAFDSVSVVIRQTIIYMFTPNNMRGRVSSVNGIFVSSSNELGAFESGLAAKLLGTIPSVIFGGVMTLLIVSITWMRSVEFFNLKFDSSESKADD